MNNKFSPKQPYEAYYVQFPFAKDLESDGIASAVVTATNNDTGADATSTVTTAANQVILGKSVFVWVKAGVSGTDYKITCRIVADDDNGSQYEKDGLLPVLEG